MKANLIKALKNNAELVEIKAGLTARKNFPDVNFENAVLIINGKIAEPDTIIQENDVVTLRLIPADLTETPWWVSTFIIPFGFLIQPAELAYKARKEAEAAERELERIKRLTNAEEIDNTPFLRGATNTIATGKSQPYFCGRNFLTPYLFSKPYYKISGTNGSVQHVYNIFEGGFKGLAFEKLGIGDTPIKTMSGSTPQSGVYTINDGVFAEGVVEIRQSGEPFSTLTELNTKVVSTVANKALVKSPRVGIVPGYPTPQPIDPEYMNFTLDPYALDVDIAITFPFGLYEYDDEGTREECLVTMKPQFSVDGGSTWNDFQFNGGNDIMKNLTQELRVVAHKDFTYSHYQQLHQHGQSAILVRIGMYAIDDPQYKNDCYVYFYQSRCFDPLKSSSPAGVVEDSGTAGLVPCLNVEANERSKSCVIGMRLKATDDNESKLTQFNFIACGTGRTWNGSEWSETKTATRNPAAIALEILTTDAHPASRYDDSEIDLDAFGAFYEYCESNDLKFDSVLTQGQKKDAVLQVIADVCGVAFYKDIYGRRSVAIDQAQENSLAVYNPQNIINITNKKTFARRVDALRIKYIDSTNDTFKENTYTVTRLENGQPVTIDENSIIKEVNATGITRHAQVVKYARRLMAIDELRPITTQIKIGFEGVYFTPYGKISIQDPSLNRDAQDTVIESAVYQSGLLKKLILRNPVTFTDPLKNYGIIINVAGSTGAAPLALKVEGTGTTRELLLSENYSSSETLQPAPNNVASFGELDDEGEFGQITHDFIITRIARTQGGFNLDLQEYNEAIYDPGTIPAYKPLINNTPTPAAGEIPPDAVTHEELAAHADAINQEAIQAAVDTIQTGHRFTNIYRVRPVDAALEDIIAKIDSEARDRSASISISDEEILLQVQDVERELVGLISVQAGAVTALVEGGGASGQMSLTLNLPVMIDAAKRQQLIGASTEEKVNAVYALVEGTAYYGIKGSASNAAVKALWDDAVAGNLIASQIELQADQIYLNGEVIVNANNKIKAALIEVENLLASNISVKDKGVIHSDNYDGTIDRNGNITAYGSAGWAIDHAGKADFVNINATGGNFHDINLTGSIKDSEVVCEKLNTYEVYIPKHDYFLGFVWLEQGQSSGGSVGTSLLGVIMTKDQDIGFNPTHTYTYGQIVVQSHITEISEEEIITYVPGTSLIMRRDKYIKLKFDTSIDDPTGGWRRVIVTTLGVA